MPRTIDPVEQYKRAVAAASRERRRLGRRKAHQSALADLKRVARLQANCFAGKDSVSEQADWSVLLADDPLLKHADTATTDYLLTWVKLHTVPADQMELPAPGIEAMREVHRACTYYHAREMRRESRRWPHPLLVLSLARWTALYRQTTPSTSLTVYPGIPDAKNPTPSLDPKPSGGDSFQRRRVQYLGNQVWEVEEEHGHPDAHMWAASRRRDPHEINGSKPSKYGASEYKTQRFSEKYGKGFGGALRPKPKPTWPIARGGNAFRNTAAWALFHFAGVDERGLAGIYSYADLTTLLGLSNPDHAKKTVARMDELIERCAAYLRERP